MLQPVRAEARPRPAWSGSLRKLLLVSGELFEDEIADAVLRLGVDDRTKQEEA